ncbi:MAG TPA: GWxTD domain-containing protein [bacterium]|nr:GWxTD domain-containing protein [bacterium]HQI48706.1 GWxTD domain-containing protein [bacterium]HQJ65039.1 GWxTD domain-containing protein [bacterium]
MLPLYRHPVVVLALMLLCAAAPLYAQVEFDSAQDNAGPRFHADLVNTAIAPASPLSRLTVYIEILFDDLQFIKQGESFEANYETAVTIFDKDNDQVDGAVWKQKVTAANYDMTNKRDRLSQSHHAFDLEPGEYKIKISVQDLETRQKSTSSLSSLLTRFDKAELSVSSLLYISEVTHDSTGRLSVSPQISDASKGIIDSTQVFMEVYAAHPPREVKVKYELFGTITHTRVRRSFTRMLEDWSTPVYFKLHADSLPQDSYLLTLELEGGGASFKTQKPFYIRWSALPASAADLRTAVEQLRYIASKNEWKRLKKAKGDALLEEFKAFWLRHDPTPGTEANETMDAFYSRVEFANQRFSVMHMPGWRTDMGLIFIVLGSPDDVERDVYPRDMKPYEIWNYYEYNRQFLFFDYTGFGDYRLETPVSIYELHRLLHN